MNISEGAVSRDIRYGGGGAHMLAANPVTLRTDSLGLGDGHD